MSTRIIDPTWFGLSGEDLLECLQKRCDFLEGFSDSEWDKSECKEMVKYVGSGGVIECTPLTRERIVQFLADEMPVIVPVDFGIINPKTPRKKR